MTPRPVLRAERVDVFEARAMLQYLAVQGWPSRTVAATGIPAGTLAGIVSGVLPRVPRHIRDRIVDAYRALDGWRPTGVTPQATRPVTAAVDAELLQRVRNAARWGASVEAIAASHDLPLTRVRSIIGAPA